MASAAVTAGSTGAADTLMAASTTKSATTLVAGQSDAQLKEPLYGQVKRPTVKEPPITGSMQQLSDRLKSDFFCGMIFVVLTFVIVIVSVALAVFSSMGKIRIFAKPQLSSINTTS
ncbi:unnamed protein product [Caenorhabditis sp. 36 PRJEB53466]|nr:unnamed protein product [Caenorhabditis sp. 36 PRJEB53466]